MSTRAHTFLYCLLALTLLLPACGEDDDFRCRGAECDGAGPAGRVAGNYLGTITLTNASGQTTTLTNRRAVLTAQDENELRIQLRFATTDALDVTGRITNEGTFDINAFVYRSDPYRGTGFLAEDGTLDLDMVGTTDPVLMIEFEGR